MAGKKKQSSDDNFAAIGIDVISDKCRTTYQFSHARSRSVRTVYAYLCILQSRDDHRRPITNDLRVNHW